MCVEFIQVEVTVCIIYSWIPGHISNLTLLSSNHRIFHVTSISLNTVRASAMKHQSWKFPAECQWSSAMSSVCHLTVRAVSWWSACLACPTYRPSGPDRLTWNGDRAGAHVGWGFGWWLTFSNLQESGSISIGGQQRLGRKITEAAGTHLLPRCLLWRWLCLSTGPGLPCAVHLPPPPPQSSRGGLGTGES